MNYGHFDDAAAEYVITTPQTPLPWMNYLGNREFFSLITNTCGGYSFCRDAKLLRLTRYRYNSVPTDQGGHYIYLKEQGTTWNPGWQPTQTPLDFYECHHGLGYSRFLAAKNGVSSNLLVFVPVEDNCEVAELKLTNDTAREKQLSVFSMIEWCLWNADDDMKNFQRNLSTGEVEIEGSVIYHKTEYRERRNHFAFSSVNCRTTHYDTDREAFLGPYRGFDRPVGIERGQLSDSVASGWSPVAAHQIDLTLAPGETKCLIFVLGYIENPETDKWEKKGVINKTRAREMIARYETETQAEQAFAALAGFWRELLGAFQVHSQDAKLDRAVNIWNQYQCMVTFNMSRSASYYESGIGRGMGFRDSCQDLTGFLHLIPARARERILDIAATQFPDGSAYHQYQPLTKKGNADIGSGFNDDPLWLIAAAAAYLRETGDLGILKEQVPFDNDPASAVPFLTHLTRSFRFTAEHKGPHGLPLIGRADWNDCLNLNCFSDHPGESFQTFGPSEGPVAESVMIAGMFVKYGRDYAEICRAAGDFAEADFADREVKKMEQAVLASGWDGQWFLRAYDAAGQPVGSASCEEGKIYIESQGFCGMAGIGLKEGFVETALQSVQRYLDTQYGIMILQPPYTVYHRELGEISSYPPGYKENAGIFCHNNPWISIAEAVCGHGERAFEVYRRTCPSYLGEISEIHRTEPYVYSQMIAGRDAPRFGEAKNSWLTGMAAWAFVNVSQYLLGIRPTMAGLSVEPCLPSDFGPYTVERRFRGTLYHISVHNPAYRKDGIPYLLVDGKKVPGHVIPLTDAAECSVEAE